MTDYFTREAVRRVMGPLRAKQGYGDLTVRWPDNLREPWRGGYESEEDFQFHLDVARMRQGQMIRWADANGLKLEDDIRSCCLDWLFRKAGRCRTCRNIVPTGVWRWRVGGTARTAHGNLRTVPAVAMVPVSQDENVRFFASRARAPIGVADAEDWGQGPMLVVYRTDLLPDFTPTAPPAP